MRKHMILSYLYRGEEKVFDFDMTNKNHCDRIIATLAWAAREGVEIYLNPKTKTKLATESLPVSRFIDEKGRETY